MVENKIQICIAHWEKDRQILSEIRRRVFIEEQAVPEDMEWDEYDSSCIHFLASLDDTAVATARLKKDGQIGRMAVLADYRNLKIGSRLLHRVLQVAAELNMNQVYLHAQVTAIPFYERHGFTERGDIFYEANIPHREMLKKLC